MADSSSSGESGSRRNFLKIGAGFVVGAVVAGAGVAAYDSSVIGSDNNSSSSVVSSLSDELSSTQAQLTDTQGSLTAAQSTISTLSSQLGSTQTALGSAQSSLSAANSQNANLSSQLTATQQSLSTANGQVASLQGTVSNLQGTLSSQSGQISSLQGQVTTANSQISSLQTQVTSAEASASALQIAVDTTTAFQTLGVDEVTLVQAIASTIIPTDSNGPGATTAGVVYFIDGQLAGKYGWSGHMYMQGPFVQHGVATPVTVDGTAYTAANGNAYTVGGTTYSAGTMATVLDDGQNYQYDMNLRAFWHDGLLALEAYASSAYGGDFETLSAVNQVKCLQDLYNNVPTNFSNIVPQDFFYEVFSLVWSGFLMDPMYGGNKGMVGWLLTGFNGLNMGNFYGEGMTTKQLMLSTTPVILKPASLGQYQKGSP